MNSSRDAEFGNRSFQVRTKTPSTLRISVSISSSSGVTPWSPPWSGASPRARRPRSRRRLDRSAAPTTDTSDQDDGCSGDPAIDGDQPAAFDLAFRVVLRRFAARRRHDSGGLGKTLGTQAKLSRARSRTGSPSSSSSAGSISSSGVRPGAAERLIVGAHPTPHRNPEVEVAPADDLHVGCVSHGRLSRAAPRPIAAERGARISPDALGLGVDEYQRQDSWRTPPVASMIALPASRPFHAAMVPSPTKRSATAMAWSSSPHTRPRRSRIIGSPVCDQFFDRRRRSAGQALDGQNPRPRQSLHPRVGGGPLGGNQGDIATLVDLAVHHRQIHALTPLLALAPDRERSATAAARGCRPRRSSR